MPYFKDSQNQLHFLDDLAFAHLLPDGCIEITEGEADLLQKIPLWKIREIKWGEIKNERDRRRFEGGVAVAGHWFLSTQAAAGEYNSILNLGLPDATVIRANWRTMDGAEVPMSPALAKQIIVAGFAQAAAIDDAATSHKAAMEASADPAAYDFSEGWPDIFGG